MSTDCGLVERIIKDAEPSGKIKIKMHYMKGQNVYQDVKDGPIKAIESWEMVILDFPIQVYLTSQKSDKKNYNMNLTPGVVARLWKLPRLTRRARPLISAL